MSAVGVAAPPDATSRSDQRVGLADNRVARNVVDLTINRFCPPVFSLLILIALGRVSSPLLGWYSVVGAYFFALQTLPYLGLTPWIMREAARRPGHIGVVFGSSLAFAATAAVTLAALLPVVIDAADYPPDVNRAIWISALTMGPYILAYACELMFVTVHRTTLISVFSVVENATKLVLSLVALALGYGLVALCWIVFVARAATAIAYCVGLKRVVLRDQRIAVDPRLLWEMLRVSPVFILNAVLFLVIQRSALLALSWYISPERIAEFAVAYRPVEVGTIVIAAFVGAVYPHLSRADGHAERGDVFRSLSTRVTGLVLVTAVVMSATILVCADTFVSMLFPKQFPEAAWLLRVLVLTLPAAGLRLCTSNMLLAKGRAGVDLVALTVGALTLAGLLMLWVPDYGVWGAAWALVVEGAVQALLRLVIVRQWYHSVTSAAATARALVSAAAIGAGAACGVFLTSPGAETAATLVVPAVYVAIMVKLRGLGPADLVFLGLRRAEALARPTRVEV